MISKRLTVTSLKNIEKLVPPPKAKLIKPIVPKPPDQFKGFLRCNVIKYIARCDKKGGLEDLKKARHYLDKLIEVCES